MCFAGSAWADPFEIKIERHVIDKEDRINRPRLEGEEIQTTLKIVVTNRSGKPVENASVNWAIVVARSGPKKAALTSGTSKLGPLANSQSATIETDAVTVVKNRNGKQELDYKVILQDAAGKQLVNTASDPKFDALASAAHPMNKDAKKKQKE